MTCRCRQRGKAARVAAAGIVRARPATMAAAVRRIVRSIKLDLKRGR